MVKSVAMLGKKRQQYHKNDTDKTDATRAGLI